MRIYAILNSKFRIPNFAPPVFDPWSGVEHPRYQVRILQRLSVVALSLALITGNAALCAGWAATPEARMACCAEGAECPMPSGSHDSASDRVLTQAQADACCAVSGRDRSSPSS